MRIEPKYVAVQPEALKPQSPASKSPKAESVATPPKGVDKSLWTLLTTEERDYFVRQAELGPLTYGPRSSAPEAAPTGRRLNRVG